MWSVGQLCNIHDYKTDWQYISLSKTKQIPCFMPQGLRPFSVYFPVRLTFGKKLDDILFPFMHFTPSWGLPTKLFAIFSVPAPRVVAPFALALRSPSLLLSSDGRKTAPEIIWSRVRFPDQEEFFLICKTFSSWETRMGLICSFGFYTVWVDDNFPSPV